MKTSVLATLLLAAAILPATAQSGPTPQEQMTCRGDASKFCAEHIGKPPPDECMSAREQDEALGRLSQGGRVARRMSENVIPGHA